MEANARFSEGGSVMNEKRLLELAQAIQIARAGAPVTDDLLYGVMDLLAAVRERGEPVARR